MAVYLTSSDCGGFQKVLYIQWTLVVRLDTLYTMKMERVTLIGKGRISHVLCMNCMKLTAKYFS